MFDNDAGLCYNTDIKAEVEVLRSNDWFTVDKKGLGQLLEKRGRGFAILELIQNAWDQNVSKVDVEVIPIEGQPLALVRVTDDDPEGFRDLTHAFTLFAPSYKKGNAEKRGRFNLGEKLVLALAKSARITSTKGTVVFDKTGRRTSSKSRERGSEFIAQIRMTRADIEDVHRVVKSLLPPEDINTTYNGAPLPIRVPRKTFAATLETEVADEDGAMRRTMRATSITVYDVNYDEGEVASIYEMGIPVVATDDQWHYDIGQRVPLNMDRDNVQPAFLRHVRTLVLNAMQDSIDREVAVSGWAQSALTDPRIEPGAVRAVITAQFGEKVVAFDPNDPEGSKIAVTRGYAVVYGRQFSAAAWNNIREADAIRPAGQVTPSPKPYSDDPNAPQLTLVDEDHWTTGMQQVAAYAMVTGHSLLKRSIKVRIANNITWPFAATYGSGELTFNLGRLGHKFFDNGITVEVDALLLHEFAHEHCYDHLSEAFGDTIARLGAQLKRL